jgi:hypothetical protein
LPQARVVADELEAELETLRRPNAQTFDNALALDVAAVAGDAVGTQEERARTRNAIGRLAPFLLQIQEWLRGGRAALELQLIFQQREFAVKQSHIRVRLTEGRDLRRDWLQRQVARSASAAPLEYRWSVVSRWLIPELLEIVP